jgi:hypothetical protein
MFSHEKSGGFSARLEELRKILSVVRLKSVAEARNAKKQIPFDYAQGRLSLTTPELHPADEDLSAGAPVLARFSSATPSTPVVLTGPSQAGTSLSRLKIKAQNQGSKARPEANPEPVFQQTR